MSDPASSEIEKWARGEIVDGSRLATDLKPHPRFQPRYLAYCAAHRKSPDEMTVHDQERFPGGLMTGYILWINAQWTAWGCDTGHLRGKSAHAVLSQEDHAAFDSWLTARSAPQQIRFPLEVA